MELLKPMIISALAAVAGAEGIVWRADSGLREMEGLKPAPPEVVFGKVPTHVEITIENGTFLLDPRDGQKTGFYFDQRENRQVLATYCAGNACWMRFVIPVVLVSPLDEWELARLYSPTAPDRHWSWPQRMQKKTAHRIVPRLCRADAIAYLEHEHPEGPFDVISIDPPAYARSKKHLPVALKAYEKLNAAAMRAVKRGGIVASSSCSHHVGRDLFVEMLRRSARKASARCACLNSVLSRRIIRSCSPCLKPNI